MVRVTEELALVQEQVNLYYTTDPFLANLPVLIFHGPSTTTNSTLNSSRIQIHVFTAAGFQSYPRITISPNSPLYASVNHLPRDRQGDEICRGLAFGLLKYFKELPEVVKSGLIGHVAGLKSKRPGSRPGSAPPLFTEQHAADLASNMVKVENIEDVISDLQAALRPQNIGYVDVDLVLPPGSIASFQEPDDDDVDEEEFFDPTLKQYGSYAPLVKLFGDVAFLPTSKLRRAPSRPTSLTRSRSFMKDQKMSLRREMAELVDTEERYVMKMNELVNHIADEFRQKARNRAFGSLSPSEQDLQKLFPKCMDRILVVNTAFLAAIKKVMDETEEDAMQDLENPIISSTSSRHGSTGRAKDPTGALAFSKVLLEWFPQFQDCYQDYIRASQEFPQIISGFLKQQSSFSQRVQQQTGEQRLRSAVIEPVQRLPRYSLFIDNIVNYLPVLHPAMHPMLKARDIITAICSLDPPETDKSQIFNRLRNLIEAWPSSFNPQGRLITAVDFLEIPAPFHAFPSSGFDSRQGMFLLFADCLVVLRKSRECNLSARGFMAEIDDPSAISMMASVTAAAGGQKYIYDFSFSGWHVLGDTRLTMSEDGRSVWITSLHELRDAGTGRDRTASAATVRSFVLQGGYEGKASKFSEEVTKAKVEGRFPEAEREADKWSLRSVRIAGGIHMYTAIFEEGIDTLKEGRKEPAPIRVVVDHEKGTKGAPVGHYGVEIVANVSVIVGGEKYKLEVDGLNDRVFIDDTASDTFMPILSKRFSDLLRLHYQSSNPALTTPFIQFYTKILKAMHLLSEQDRSKTFRPASPVKMISSFLGGGGFSSSTSSLSNSASSRHSRTPVMGGIPTMSPSMQRKNSSKSIQEFMEGQSSLRATTDESRPTNPLVRLEETFTGYVAALQSRKGNVVGRTLRSRGGADELAVNDIYNKFIEFPFDLRTSSDAPFDVLFVAFEKFLRMAWKEQMGQVMSVQTLDALQEKALRMYTGDFADYVKTVFGEMAPQNRRAFIAIIKLLADLLDGCGNDGDRGALTAAFAELLVTEGEPHNYINLLDRVVEDSERLFEDIGPGASTNFGSYSNSTYGSLSSAYRSTPSNTGSLTSNASSLRRRFADTLLRSNSSNRDRPSMWRTLSKTDRSVATGEPLQPSSLSKGSFNRARSTTIETPQRRPASRDRPTVMGAFDERPSSSGTPQVPRLSPIGASPPAESSQKGKKKRRSSLSDLKTLMAAATLGSSPLSLSPKNKATLNKLNSPRTPATPMTPSPTKIPLSNGGGIMDRNRSVYRTSTPDPEKQKENKPSLMPSLINSPPPRNLVERSSNIPSPAPAPASEAVVFKDPWTPRHSKTSSLSSNIPTLRGRGNSVARPTTSGGPKSPGKLRLQSPQKLRERLRDEAKAIDAAESGLRSELSKIGEEMAKFNMTPSSASSPAINKLSAQLKTFESRIPVLVSDLNSRNETLRTDMEKVTSSLEEKVKGLDQLYKESSAENELLYEKFNGELGKIVKALRGKGKEDKEELITKMREASEEAAKTKKENARLRREIVTLRTLLKSSE